MWHDTSLTVDERTDALLSAMTLQDKIFQLGSFWERNATEDPMGDNADSKTHDVAPMESEFAQTRLDWDTTTEHGLGQITRPYGSDPQTVAQGREKLVRLQKQVLERSAFGIPAVAHEECLTGFTALGATVYPASIAWGATWRPELINQMAQAIGSDLRAVGVHQGLSPLLDVVRDYRWGRVEETCGEDPYLVGTLGTAYVQGLQSQGVMATLKHFVGYPNSRAGRNHAPVSAGVRELENLLLPPFEMAVREGGVASVMNSYSDVDGEPPAASYRLLTEILRDRWGFDGTVVSDYWSVKFLGTMHRIAATDMEAAVLSLSAGMDVELPETGCFIALERAVDEGILDPAIVDVACRRILRQKVALGLLDPDYNVELDADPHYDLDSARNREVARRVAEESVVLLKNNGILPLSRTSRAAVIGPTWTDVRSYLGCYSFPNHVLSRFEGAGNGLEITSLVDALSEIFDETPAFVEGTGFLDGSDEDLAAAVAAARSSELAVVTIGDIAGLFGGGSSGEGCDVADLGLPGRQGELLEAVLDTGTPTVAVLVTGRPYALGKYADRCAAIVQAFMPGVEGSDAIAGVLSGRLNPSGRLPISIPDDKGALPGTYLAEPLAWFTDSISNLDPRPLFPFGAGESYTSFELADPAASAGEISVDGTVEYTVTVRNTGTRDGSEVVQLYVQDPWAEVVRPLKQLVGYLKVDLAAGEARRVRFTLHADRFSFVGRDYQRIVEPGEILLSAGHSSEDRLAPTSVTLVGERRVVREGRVLVTPAVSEPVGEPVRDHTSADAAEVGLEVLAH